VSLNKNEEEINDFDITVNPSDGKIYLSVCDDSGVGYVYSLESDQ
jgi:hypothetical protein